MKPFIVINSVHNYFSQTAEWKAAMEEDGKFISGYAKENPTREDVSESSTSWFAVRKRRNRQTEDLVKTTEATIPNRLDYFNKHIGGAKIFKKFKYKTYVYLNCN